MYDKEKSEGNNLLYSFSVTPNWRQVKKWWCDIVKSSTGWWQPSSWSNCDNTSMLYNYIDLIYYCLAICCLFILKVTVHISVSTFHVVWLITGSVVWLIISTNVWVTSCSIVWVISGSE